jgi:protein TonB
MDINKILNSDYLDIIFEGRNKVYGGYELRKNYPKRVLKSLLVIAGIGVCGGIYGVVNMSMKAEKKVAPMLKQVTLAEPPPIDPRKPPPPPPPPPPPVKPTVKFTPPVIKKDEEVKEEEVPPPQKEIIAAGPKTEAGDPNGIDPGITSEKGTGVVAAPPPPTIFTYVEQMPKADYDVNVYLAKNLKYPDAARESNIDGRVIVNFVVSEDGGISDVKVVRGIGAGCDEEAKRVVREMPKWKPGKQNGKAVKVSYTLPILFKLE